MRPLPTQAVLVVNAMSRRGADAFDEVRQKLVAAGIELIEAHAVHDPDQMDVTVKDAIANAPMVIVGGGDGSLSSNIDLFLGQDTVFAIIPLGTANSFARSEIVIQAVTGGCPALRNPDQRRSARRQRKGHAGVENWLLDHKRSARPAAGHCHGAGTLDRLRTLMAYQALF